MASSLFLERIRSLHEELETLEKAIVELLEHKPKGHRDNLLADLKIAAYTAQAQQVSARLVTLYTDKQNNAYEYQNELALMQGKLSSMVSTLSVPSTASSSSTVTSSSDPLHYFYQCLTDTTDSSRRSTTSTPFVTTLSSSTATVSSSPSSSTLLENANRQAEILINSFTDEELFGKYIDIQNTIYEEFINLPGIKEYTVASSSSSSVAASASTSERKDPSIDYTYFQKMDYMQYLKRLTELHGTVPYKTKITRPYRRYLVNFLHYLSIFFQKRYPLVNVSELIDKWFKEFENIYHHGQLPGWKPSITTVVMTTDTVTETTNEKDSVIDLTVFTNDNDILTKLGNDECKNQLRLRGLKQGGTPNERANRLWIVRNLSPDQYPKKLLAPSSSSSMSVSSSSSSSSSSNTTTTLLAAVEPMKEDNSNETTVSSSSTLPSSSSTSPANLPINYIDIVQYGTQRLGGNPLVSISTAAWCEVAITHFIYLLNDIIKDTRRRIEKRQTKTYEEISMERQVEYDEVTKKHRKDTITTDGTQPMIDSDDDDDDEDTPIYNPLNIPLGWDGKPIPYWLYKLHGLNIEYVCEICGNEKYQGRRNYDRHFQENKHAYGMRCLGIPNTKHFHDITKIADAQKLYERIKHTLKEQSWKADTNEEFEDSLGNVLNRKTYEDLARQGLL